eukprot:6209787-Pleurochrysis_carterae.AAC.1
MAEHGESYNALNTNKSDNCVDELPRRGGLWHWPLTKLTVMVQTLMRFNARRVGDLPRAARSKGRLQQLTSNK